MRKVTLTAAVLLSLSLAGPALAVPLLPGTSQFQPGAAPPPGSSNYSTAPPAYFTPGNIVAAPLPSSYVPAIGNLTGVVTSIVYQDPVSGNLGFQYHFTSTGSSDLVRATLDGAAWQGVTITDAGADGTGSSTPGPFPPAWSNGDPYFLGRDPSTYGEGLSIQWQVFGQGTVLRAGDASSQIFYDTMAQTFAVGNVGLINGGAVSYAQGYAPGDVPIPEPGALIVFAGGLVGFRRRRRR